MAKEETIKFDKELDVRGLNCPLPLLRTKKILSQMGPGEVLKVLTTDPTAEIDFRAYSEATENAILSLETAGRCLIILIEKKRVRAEDRSAMGAARRRR